MSTVRMHGLVAAGRRSDAPVILREALEPLTVANVPTRRSQTLFSVEALLGLREPKAVLKPHRLALELPRAAGTA